MPPDAYQIVPTKPFLKDLKTLQSKFSRAMAERIHKAIESLAEDPFQGKKLRGVDFGVWRIRIGDYRLRYDIDGKKVILHIIRHRKEVYR